MIRVIAFTVLVLVTASSGLARADREGGAYNRVVLVVDTSCSMRERFETALAKTAEALPRLARYPEDELMVVALNGAPDVVWEGRARALRRPRADGGTAWEEILDKLSKADRGHTDIVNGMGVIATLLARQPPPSVQYVLVWSDMVHDPPPGGPGFDIARDVPWRRLEGNVLYLVGLATSEMAAWQDALAERGLARRGGVVGAAGIADWRPEPVERAVEAMEGNPLADRVRSLAQALGTAASWGEGALVVAASGLVGLVPLALAIRIGRRLVHRPRGSRPRRTAGSATEHRWHLPGVTPGPPRSRFAEPSPVPAPAERRPPGVDVRGPGADGRGEAAMGGAGPGSCPPRLGRVAGALPGRGWP